MDDSTIKAVRAADAAISDQALESEFRAWWQASWGRHLLSRGQEAGR